MRFFSLQDYRLKLPWIDLTNYACLWRRIDTTVTWVERTKYVTTQTDYLLCNLVTRQYFTFVSTHWKKKVFFVVKWTKKRFRNKHILHSVHSIIIITAIDRNFLKTIKNISLSFTNQNASFHYGQIELYTCVIVLEHLTKYAKGFWVILHVHFLPNDFNLNTN